MTLEEIIKKGLAEVGTKEIPENQVKYNTWYYGTVVNGSSYPWCAAFLSWLFNGTGVDFPKTASCADIYNYARSKGRLVQSGYQVGDVFIYSWNGNGSYDHTGIVTEVNGSSYTVLEGNCSDMVKTITRTSANVVGAYRPPYSKTTTASGTTAAAAAAKATTTVATASSALIPDNTTGIGVAMLQGALQYLGYSLGRCGVDGDAGSQTSYTNTALRQAVAAGKISKTTVDYLLKL